MQNPGVTWRSVLIGALLIPPNAYWLLQLEMAWGGTYTSVLTLLLNAVFSLLLVVGLNLLVNRLVPHAALSHGELLIIYIMLAEGMSLCGCDVLLRYGGLSLYRRAVPLFLGFILGIALGRPMYAFWV